MKKIISVFIIVIIFFLGCKTSYDYDFIKVTSKTEDDSLVKLAVYPNYRFALVFPTWITISNSSNKKEYLMNIGFNTSTDVFSGSSTYFYVYQNNNVFYKTDGIPVLESKNSLEYKAFIRIVVDSLQTKQILNYYQISEYPTIKDTITLSNFKKSIQDLKKIRTYSDSTLYEQLFKTIDFSFTLNNEIHDKVGFTIYYDWINNKTYNKYKK